MKRAVIDTTIIVCLVAQLPFSLANAAGIRTIDTFGPVVDKVEAYATEYGGDRVLLVADIDNTLLAMDRQLGSDQWFQWQEHLLEHEPQSPYLVADDFSGLLEVQGLLFATTRMHPPEPEQPRQIAAAQRLGVYTMVLTSRGDDFRAAAVRELNRAGYDFASTSPAIRLFAKRREAKYETCSRFLPYRSKALRAFGLKPEEAKIYGLSDAPREVSYGDGVFMVAGQHKGCMLLVFLHLAPQSFDAVVFVDDHLRHAVGVHQALSDRGIEVTAFHYTREQDRVDQFTYGKKKAVDRQWRRIQRALRHRGDDANAPALVTP